MNIKKYILPCFLALNLSAPVAMAKSPWHNWGQGKATPENFDKMWTQVISTPVESVDGSFAVDGIVDGDGMNFFQNVLELSDDEIAEYRQEALDFFSERFGLDENTPGTYFTGFESIPETNYRVVWSSGENVPSDGWRLDDGGFLITVTDPEGIVLGGEFEGRHIPAGSFVTFGTYHINRTVKTRRGKLKPLRPLVVSYRAGSPVVPSADGSSIAIACDVITDRWGEGAAIGHAVPRIMPDGKVALNMRMVVSFPPLGDIIEDQLED